MPRQRFETLDLARQQALLSIAAAEFAARGLEGASINRIVRESGVSKGAMYYWFEDKQDLFVHTVRTVLQPMAAAIGKPGPVGSADGFWQAVDGMVRRGWAWLRGDATGLSLLRAAVRAHGAGELDNRWAELVAPAHAAATEIVLLGQAVGAVRDDLPIDLLIAVMLGIGEAADLWFEDRLDELDEDEVHGALEALQDVLKRVASAGS